MPIRNKEVSVAGKRLGLGALALVGTFAVGTGGAAAKAQFGVQGGLTDGPSSVFVGAHFYVAHVARSFPRLAFEPGAEIGFHDGFTSLRFNGRLKWIFPLDQVDVYPIGGLSLYHVSVDHCVGDCSGNNLGLDLGGGVRHERLSADLTLGFGDIPDLTLTVGYTFGL
jgi:hypothetical protein